MLPALTFAYAFVIDGGDVERQVTLPADCATAVEQVRESRRLLRNAALTFGIGSLAGAFDIGTTAYVDNKRALNECPPGSDQCFVEWNTLTPTSLGLVAAKFGLAVLFTGLEYVADRWAPQRWVNKLIMVIAGLSGVIPGIHNLQVASSIR
jgi:hypothetical protein